MSTTDSVNTYPVSSGAIVLISCTYPFNKVRKDMSMQEYIRYKVDWDFFNYVWAYNWTISTVNGLNRAAGRPGNLSSYAFLTNQDQLSYTNGLISHAAVYISAAAAGAFMIPQ
jgi:hypothetical protein